MVSLTGWLSTDAMSPAELNLRKQEIEDEFNDRSDGSSALASPAISSFANATHDHSDAANGGQIGVSAIDSGAATSGQVLTADGAGNASFASNNNSFQGLSDTPSGYSGKKHNLVRVNNAETALAYISLALCSLQRTSVQGISSGGSGTNISWTGTDIHDPANMHDPAGANPERITIPETGTYQVSAQIEWNTPVANGTVRLEIWRRDNSTATDIREWYSSLGITTGGGVPQDVSKDIYIDDTADYLYFKAFHNTTGTLNILAPASPQNTSLRAQVTLLRAHP